MAGLLAGERAGPRKRGQLGVTGLTGLETGFGYSSVLFLFLSPLFYFPTTLKLFEFKFEFEFNPSTQTKRTMHQHECTNKLALKNFNYFMKQK